MLHVDIQFSQYHLFRDYSFPIMCYWTPWRQPTGDALGLGLESGLVGVDLHETSIPADPGRSELLAVVVQLLSHVRLFVTPWTAAHQAFLSFTISWSLLKLMSIESVTQLPLLCYPFSPALSLSHHHGLFQ